MTIVCGWRARFRNEDVNALHARAFGSTPEDWWGRVNRHSLGWVCAHDAGRLAGFVNVAWDGGTHAFLLDTVVAEDLRRGGVGRELVAVAAGGARAAGCSWLHVDFEERLRSFYRDACGFRPTAAGLIALRPTGDDEQVRPGSSSSLGGEP